MNGVDPGGGVPLDLASLFCSWGHKIGLATLQRLLYPLATLCGFIYPASGKNAEIPCTYNGDEETRKGRRGKRGMPAADRPIRDMCRDPMVKPASLFPDARTLKNIVEATPMQLTRKILLSTLAGAVAFCAQAQAREFRSADVQPEDYPTVKAQKFMSDELGKLTNGKYSIKVFHSGQLGSEKDTIEQLKLGAIDFLRVNTGALNEVCKATILPVLPFVFKSVDQMHHVVDGPIGEAILKECEPQGMVGLAYYDSGARSFYTKKPIKTLADLKGLKIRVQQTDLWVAVMKALGINATPMPYGEVFTGLKTGLIDGAENNWPSYQSTHHYEVAKYYTLTEHSMAPEVLLMSKRVWDTLSPDDQKAIRQAAKDSVPYMRKLWQEMEVTSRAEVEKAGVTVQEIDKAPFQAAVKPVYDQFVTDPKLKSLLEQMQATN
jgi:tripartite ATP-independent transporter DctP family solute receptor